MAMYVYKRKFKKVVEGKNAAIKNEDVTTNLDHSNICRNKYFVVTSCRRNQDKKKIEKRQLEEFVAPIAKTNVVKCHKFEKLVYPVGDVDAVTITVKDIEILKSTAFINDNIIDFYMKYLQTTLGETEKRKFYIFSCFFFTKLCIVNREHIVKGIDGLKIAIESVEKWIRDVSIFEKDYILIPINERLHWSLIIVCHPGIINNMSSEELMKTSCILHLDSHRGSHREGVEEHIRKFLLYAWISEHPAMIHSSVEMAISNMKYIEVKVPQQENEYDCGTYLLHYSELFMRETPKVFTEHWFHASEATTKRERIYNLILSLEGVTRKKSILHTRRGLSKCSKEVENILDDNCFRVRDFWDGYKLYCYGHYSHCDKSKEQFLTSKMGRVVCLLQKEMEVRWGAKFDETVRHVWAMMEEYVEIRDGKDCTNLRALMEEFEDVKKLSTSDNGSLLIQMIKDDEHGTEYLYKHSRNIQIQSSNIFDQLRSRLDQVDSNLGNVMKSSEK